MLLHNPIRHSFYSVFNFLLSFDSVNRLRDKMPLFNHIDVGCLLVLLLLGIYFMKNKREKISLEKHVISFMAQINNLHSFINESWMCFVCDAVEKLTFFAYGWNQVTEMQTIHDS